MNIEKLIESLGEAGAKVLFHKEKHQDAEINVQSLSGNDVLTIMLKKLSNEGKFNEAENIIFERVEDNPSKELCQIALNYYNTLLEKDDQELKTGNFSKEEIYQGIEDIKKISLTLN